MTTLRDVRNAANAQETKGSGGYEVRGIRGGSWENGSARSQRELTPGHDHSPAKDK